MTLVTRYRLPAVVLDETFAELRRCGQGRRECQLLWTSPWITPELVDQVIHPRHQARGDGFELDGAWLNAFWQQLTRTGRGVRVQIHTHPGAAFHSPTDDAWPIIHTPGFLSLVIPRFASGDVGFEGAYLAELQEDGSWREVPIETRLDLHA